MSADTGAPPPPPPPPPTSFDSLPAELLLNIIGFLKVTDYVKFALAIYPLLESRGLVPSLTPDIFRRITQQPSTLPAGDAPETCGEEIRAAGSSSGTSQSKGRGATIHIPLEIHFLIMEYLEPADRIAWIFSHREMFLRFLPALSKGTKKRLWEASQKSKQ